MTLLRRLARARLASQVIRRLRRAGVGDTRYDARTFSVRFTPDGHDVPAIIELGGLLADRSGGRRSRRARMERFVAGFLRTPGLPADGVTARPMLRPVLRGATPMPADVSAPLRRAALQFLFEYVVIDQPDTMTYASADQLRDWGMTADEVFAAARANLSGAVLHGVASEPAVVQFLDDGDAYWTSHLLLDGWLARLADQVGGAPVAFAPERGTLIVTADGSAHLPGLFAQAERAYTTSPRAISPMAYVSDEHGHTVPYAAPPGHPMHGCVRRAESVLAVTEYARQAVPPTESAAELLLVGPEPGGSQRRDPHPERPDPASPHSISQAPALAHLGGWRTRAIWPRNEPTLLPRADEVLIGDTITPWQQLEPHLTRVPDLDPPRWRATAWPNADETQATPP